MNPQYLTDIIFLLVAAVIAVPFSRTLGLGAVPGFLVAGLVVGPSGLGLIGNVIEIHHLAEFGIVLLLFVIGIEIRPSRLWLMRRTVFGLGTLQVLVTGALITGIAYFVFALPLRVAILVGPALALSSTAFVLQLLTEQKLLSSAYGRASFGVLLAQDLAVVPLLALTSLLAMPDLTIWEDIALALIEAVAILTTVILGGRYFLQPVLHRVARSGTPEVFTASAVLLVLGTAVMTERIGLSMPMGAFLAGVLIADSPYRHQVMAEIQPFRGFLVGLFFMSMGMSLNLSQFLEQPIISLGLVGALMSVKVIVLWPLTRLFGIRGRSGLAMALLLAQGGEFALVLFAPLPQLGLLSEELFQKLLLAVLFSMFATPFLARLAHQLVLRRSENKAEYGEHPAPAPVVLAGFGGVGHRIGQILAMAEIPYVAIDHDVSRVAHERSEGQPVFFGEVQSPEVLRSAGAFDASLVIVTLDDLDAAERVVSVLRHANPDLPILARGHNMEECCVLRRLGAKIMVSENLEASLELARAALERLGGDYPENEALLARFRHDYYALIDEAGRAQR
jgi:monovalent cation:proton antiporter-2 (CPA2) family protein